MSFFTRVYNAFSKRNMKAGFVHDIPVAFRNKIFFWCKETFQSDSFNSNLSIHLFCSQIYRVLIYRHGDLRLSEDIQSVFTFLLNCPGDQFLDFIEDLFAVQCLFYVSKSEDQLIGEINDLFRYNELPYQVTSFIKEEAKIDKGPFVGKTGTKIVGYPKVIMRQNEVIHELALKPALAFLQNPQFQSANKEFMGALEDYRRGDFGDCLTKCNSSFESVLKIICDIKKWTYNQSDTSGKLVKIVISNLSLESYLEPSLLITATIRNKLSTSHGAGSGTRKVSEHIACYAINSTASAILLLKGELERRAK